MKPIISLLVGFILTLSTCASLIAQTVVQEDTVMLKGLEDLSISGGTQILKGLDTLNISDDSSRSEVSYDTTASSFIEPKAPIGEIETIINYNAQDSIFFDLKSSKLTLYGESHIDYGEIELDSDETQISMTDRIITSTYSLDSAGRKQGKPIFTEKGTVYETDFIIYNLKTKRAQIKGVITEQMGAFMHGQDVKKNERNEMYISEAMYSTCNLTDPHFHIQSKQLKVTKRNIISGPFNLRFREIKTPLWFPFGMFPKPKEKTSGILVPTYGEETRRGFFLRDGGYYWAVNDYMDIRTTGSVFSNGGYGAVFNTNFKKRYVYTGGLNFSYNKNIIDSENGLSSNDFWIRSNLKPLSKGNSSVSASISAGTTTYNSNNNLATTDFNRSISSQFSSNISYRQKFANAPINLTMNARHRQNVQTGVMTFNLPELSLNVNRQYPFKKLAGSNMDVLKKLGLSYNFVAKNEITNKLAKTNFPFTVANQTSTQEDQEEELKLDFKNAKNGGQHKIPIATSVKLFNKLNLSPNFNLTEYWYTKELDYTYLPELEAVQVDTLQKFSRALSWNSGASLSTIIYGTRFFKPGGYIQAIRHVVTPSISFSYTPDITNSENSPWEWIQKNEKGDSVLMSKYHQFAYGSPRGNMSKTLSFGLQNNLEIKVRDKKDTLGIGYKKIKLFDNFSLNSGYNFAADSFNLSNINLSTRTSFFKGKLSLNIGGTLDPYVYNALVTNEEGLVTRQERIDRFSWQNGQGLGNLSRFNTAISLNLKPKGSSDVEENNGRNDFVDQDINNQEELGLQDAADLDYIYKNPNEYVNFNIPWSLRFSYSINVTQSGLLESRIRQTLTFSGDVSLTPKTKINFRSGYDLEKNKFTQTSIGVNRDLHCWSLSFNWIPFGRNQSFNLIIRPKSALLQDLKLQKRKSFQDFF